MSLPSDGGTAKPAPYLERQRALLYHMLTATREQRRCLIQGDLKGLEETNRLLGSLLESQQTLHGQAPNTTEGSDPGLIDELRSLAQELRQESRTNYLLACRGAQFADLSISLLAGADGTGRASNDLEAAALPSRSHLVDHPA